MNVKNAVRAIGRLEFKAAAVASGLAAVHGISTSTVFHTWRDREKYDWEEPTAKLMAASWALATTTSLGQGYVNRRLRQSR